MIEALKTVSSEFAAARAVHMTSCAVLASVFVFERVIARRCGAVPKRGFVILISLVMFVISGIGWLAAATIDMTGLPASEALSRENLDLVLSTTDFGHLWIFRFAVFGAAIVAWILLRMIRKQRQQAACFGLLPASFCWAVWRGRGTADSGTKPTTHLIADAMHLLIIAIWPGGLLPLWLTLSKNIDVDSLVAIVNRFSKLALLSVAILIGSGWINSWMLVAEWHGLFDTPYGQVLLIKLGLLAMTAADRREPICSTCARESRRQKMQSACFGGTLRSKRPLPRPSCWRWGISDCSRRRPIRLRSLVVQWLQRVLQHPLQAIRRSAAEESAPHDAVAVDENGYR